MKDGHDFLTVEDFNLFINTIPNLHAFISNTGRPPMSPERFQLLFKLMFFCGLQATEVLKLTKSDFDIENQILTIKSDGEKIQKTTITPNLIGELKTTLEKIPNDEKIFKTTRSTVWRYAKNTCQVAKLVLFKQQKERDIQGAYTALFRNSCKRHMLNNNANPDLVSLKLRLFSPTNYGRQTLNDLKRWENRTYRGHYLTEKEIEENVKWYSDQKNVYEKLSEKVKTILEELFELRDIECTITSRVKNLPSFEKKIRSNIRFDPKDMQDLAGIRVITSLKSDVEKVSAIIQQTFSIDKSRTIDKSKILGEDKMGYASIQYVAKLPKHREVLEENKPFIGLYFEIQVRTILQHAWAEIEHDRVYKNSTNLSTDVRRRFNLVASLLETADNEFQSLSDIEEHYAKQSEITDSIDGGNLDLSIDTTSLEQYLLNVFGDMPDLERSYGTFPERVIRELNVMGIDKLSQLAKIVPPKLKDVYIKNNSSRTYYGIIIDILIIDNAKLFFEKAFSGDISELQIMPEKIGRDLGEFDIDIVDVLRKYKKLS